MNNIIIVPELNYWMGRILNDSSVTDTFTRIPSEMTDYWRDPNSIIELLFNENFQPVSQPSSSSSSFFDSDIFNDKPYTYLYRKCNILSIQDKNILRRTQMYRWYAFIFASNNEKFIDIFDFSNTEQEPIVIDEIEPSPPKSEYYDQSFDRPTLPKDVREVDRSKYITYTTQNYLSTNYPLIQEGFPQKVTLPVSNSIYSPAQNIFGLVDSDFQILDKLYSYKVGLIGVSLNGIDFYSLTPLGKLIYIYLDAFLNNSFQYYNDENPIGGSDILSSLYEKFVLNMIYNLIQKQYGVYYKEVEAINTDKVEINIDQMMLQKKENKRIILTTEQYITGEIILDEHPFFDRKDFVIWKDGKLLIQDVDFAAILDFTNIENPVAKVQLLTDIYSSGDSLELLWSYVEPYVTPYTQIDQ